MHTAAVLPCTSGEDLCMCVYGAPRCAIWDLVKALEKEAAHCSSILQGLQQSPPAEKWAALTERYQQLQHQVHQQQQSLKPSELQESLSAGMEPCQVSSCVTKPALRYKPQRRGQ